MARGSVNPLISMGSFGPYTLESLLGRGRTGEIYRAYDERHRRVVALKILTGSFSADGEYRERFDRVSQVVVRLSVPHLLPVNEHGEIQGRLFRDTRLVTGSNLGVRLHAGAIPADQAVEMVCQLATALDSLHGAGVAHGDVKPSDVLCAAEGVLLADAGVAHPRLRPCYPVPEWSEGRLPDPGADVFALACLL